MEEWLTAFHFLRPWLLLLMIIPIWWLVKTFKSGVSKSSWEKVIDAKLLNYLLIKGSSSQRQIMAWLAGIGLLFAIIAAAGPSWKKQEIQAMEPENPLMIALNLSTDMENNDISPNRLVRAKFKLKDLLEHLKDVQSGLMVYSSEPFVISPFSDDANIIVNLLPAIGLDVMPQNGDRVDRAIELTVDKFRSAGYVKGNILLVTSDVGQSFEQALKQAKQAYSLGYKVNILSVNKEKNEKLEMLANQGGGRYILLTSGDEDISTLITEFTNGDLELNKGRNWQSVWLDYGYYLLSIPLICCLYFFRKGILILVFLMLSSNVQAGFFLNDNQEGLREFSKGNFAEAEKKFTISEWKGASSYRQGNYEKAYSEFAKENSETALYNQGNALAKGGKISEAIAKYEDVLEINPNHEDAKFNLEYLKKQQQNQQNQQQNQQTEQNEDEKSDEQSGAGGSSDNKTKDKQEEQKPQSGNAENEQQQNSDVSEQKGEEQQSENNNRSQSMGENKVEDNLPQVQSGGVVQQGEDEQEYDEKIQARTQQYREIPEDAGGLLRAFIRKEFEQQRYRDKP